MGRSTSSLADVVSHLDLQWEDPMIDLILSRLVPRPADHVRPPRLGPVRPGAPTPPTLEEQMDDVRAVLDAAGSERAALFAPWRAGRWPSSSPPRIPERATGAGALRRRSPAGRAVRRHPVGHAPPTSARRPSTGLTEEPLGRGRALGRAGAEPRRTTARGSRVVRGAWSASAASPSTARRDISSLTARVRRPQRSAVDQRADAGHRTATRTLHRPSRHAHVPRRAHPRRAVRDCPAADHLPVSTTRRGRSTRSRSSSPGPRHGREPDRVLATVMFTDIVGSTERAARAGRRALARRSSSATTSWCAASSTATAGARSRPPATASWPPSTGRRAAIRCAEAIARRRCARSASRSAPGCTPASASCVGDDVGGHRRPHRRPRRRAGRARRGARLQHGQGPRRRAPGIEFADRGDARAQGRPGRVAPVRRRHRQRPERVAASLLDSGQPGGRSSAGRAPGCGPGGRGFESPRSPSMSDDDDPLERLSTKELHDLAVSRAKRHVDLGFFWHLFVTSQRPRRRRVARRGAGRPHDADRPRRRRHRRGKRQGRRVDAALLHRVPAGARRHAAALGEGPARRGPLARLTSVAPAYFGCGTIRM